MKILHVLYQSLPQVSGSSIRSRDILMSQKNIGLDVVAVTSGFQGSIDGENEDIIDDIRYIRTSSRKKTIITDNNKGVIQQFKKFLSIFTFAFKLLKIVKKEKPDVLHAHAMFFCGIPTALIGRWKKIPVVYEFRSLWMFQKKDGSKSKLNRFVENFLVSLEAFTLKKADVAVFLNKELENYFSSKGKTFKKKYVINNAVNLDYIDDMLIKQPKTKERNEIVFGYIGTLTAYEGIEFLVETFQELYQEGIKNKLLIYGNGISKDAVVNQIEKHPEISNVNYMGSVEPNEIPKAFSEIDVIVNPRLDNEVTQSVTPLKPLEAMAYRKVFVGSDVGGIAALVKQGFNGFLFRAEDKTTLKATIRQVIHLSNIEKSELLIRARNFVEKEKSWKKNAADYKAIYQRLINYRKK